MCVHDVANSIVASAAGSLGNRSRSPVATCSRTTHAAGEADVCRRTNVATWVLVWEADVAPPVYSKVDDCTFSSEEVIRALDAHFLLQTSYCPLLPDIALLAPVTCGIAAARQALC